MGKSFMAAVCIATALTYGTLNCAADDAPSLPAGVQDIVKLVKAGLGEDVVMAQIKHAGSEYKLSVDQIIYLSKQGVTQNEIKAMLDNGNGASSASAPATAAPAPAPATPPTTATPAPPPADAGAANYPPPATPPPDYGAPSSPPASLSSFQSQLMPYGSWIEEPGYGTCWRPAVERDDPYWRPYCDGGYWDYTDAGWTWQSEYPWGQIVFHYGRWFRDPSGWVWVPGYDWAPAWVTWRQAEGYCGWAPLPPGAVFRPGVGLWYNGAVAMDVDFGLGPDAFVFVSYDHFWNHHLRGFLLPRERRDYFFVHSVILNGYRFENGRFFIDGLGRERMAGFTHHEIRFNDRYHDRYHDDRFHDDRYRH